MARVPLRHKNGPRKVKWYYAKICYEFGRLWQKYVAAAEQSTISFPPKLSLMVLGHALSRPRFLSSRRNYYSAAAAL